MYLGRRFCLFNKMANCSPLLFTGGSTQAASIQLGVVDLLKGTSQFGRKTHPEQTIHLRTHLE